MSDSMTSRDIYVELLSATLNSDILEIFCYAAYSVVYMFSVYLIVFSNSKAKLTSQHKALAGMISLFWVVLTVRVGCVWQQMNVVYIKHGASREDEIATLSVYETIDILGAMSFYILILLADLIMIWRTWALYAHRWLAIVLPVLTMLMGLCGHPYHSKLLLPISLLVVAVGFGLTIDLNPASTSDSVILVRLRNIDWSSIYYSMVVWTNTLCTVLIIGRIIFLTGWRTALRTYGGIVNILVESAIIYSGAFIIQLALRNHDKTLVAYLCIHALLPTITCFAPTLVILRVASGHAVTNTSVVPSTGVSAPIHFADRTPDVDVESNAGM